MNYSQFIVLRRTRDNENDISICANSPKEFTNFVTQLHDKLGYHMRPDSWVLDVLKRALKTFENPKAEIVPPRADYSKRDLIEWLHTDVAIAKCDEILKQINTSPVRQDLKLLEIVQMAQEQIIFKIFVAATIFAEVYE